MEIITRITNKIRREIVKKSRKNIPFHKQTTYVEKNNQWYDPVLVNIDTFVKDCSNYKTILAVSKIIDKLSDDDYLKFLRAFYKTGINNFGKNWEYADILTVLYGICHNISIDSYLEIGVRRARSMAIVASIHPNADLIGFDLWIQDYAGMKNPGSEFVRNEIKNLDHKGKIKLIAGDSKKTVPQYFKENPNVFFDLVTVDGDHSKRGAIIDLKNVIPRIKVGGLLVFDDIDNPHHQVLTKVWNIYIKKSKRFLSHEFTGAGLGVGLAIKIY